jgi:anti-sigma factor RsiW
MKRCWPDGDLRAYLDGELPLETVRELGAHLDTCAECRERHLALSGRAARVASLMAMLPEAAPAGTVSKMPARAGHRRQWAVAALSLAAALAIGFVMLPKRTSQPAPVAKVPAGVMSEAVPETGSGAAAAPAEQSAAAMPDARAHAVQRRSGQPAAAQQADYFLRLDDEPIETGTVVRVGAENGDVQADLILGPDGRAHAIRVVGNQ